jgi:hypothetical protein
MTFQLLPEVPWIEAGIDKGVKPPRPPEEAPELIPARERFVGRMLSCGRDAKGRPLLDRQGREDLAGVVL